MEVLGMNATVKDIIISCSERPGLKRISTLRITVFWRVRQLYKKRLEEKGTHLKEVVATSYSASIEEDELRIFIAAGGVEFSSIDELTEERCKKEVTREELYLFGEAVKSYSGRGG